VEADFAGHRSRRDIVGSTEGGKEVVQGDFIGHVDDREARAPTIAIAVKQIVVTDSKVKQTPWSNARYCEPGHRFTPREELMGVVGVA
jgi:hypothetical protein